ncbi:unnamed protein product [Adineta ricciae]|uniref:PHD-type domain-containing protein n=1 Tax=Adineta ricciae TaxID=249248 RepID=A0A813VJH6_ADIRI|nr:unnamed protein product [Adineta ricciae]CAF1042613.1 unnamed protein product [Adineta ricciae]
MIMESSSSKENDIGQEQRRIRLLNDPNYGLVLCFLDKFRTVLDLPYYPYQLFEDHLVHNQESNPLRLIDFHFVLLKRISLAKNAQREKFNSIIAKFMSRSDPLDSEQLTATGYSQADVNLKIRIIKNLLESQFDSNQTFKAAFIEQSACELRSLPLGRDRFGAVYWFFMDNDGFVRLFREDTDDDRTWTNIAKNRNELENFVRLLVTDSIVRQRFSDWVIDDEAFSALPPSNDFEQYYVPIQANLRDEEKKVVKCPKRKRGRAKCFTKSRKKKKKNFVEASDEQENSDVEIDQEKPQIRQEEKIRSAVDESQHEETSLDEMSLAVRRSSRTRTRKVPTSEFISQIPDPPTRMSAVRHCRRRRRRSRRRTNRRNTDDYLCSSTSSSDEHIDDISEDEDDYVYPVEADDHFFDLEEENGITADTKFHTAKTAQNSTIITSCFVCSNGDRPEILLLCDGCNDAYHLDCLTPILVSVPDGDWYCPLCEHRQLANRLIAKLKDLISNLNLIEAKQRIRLLRKTSQRKIKVKDYSSDESITASESDKNDDSMLSTSQINENSNLSSSYFDDEKSSISQRGRYRRTRFDISKMFDDDYDVDNDTEKTDINLQLPEKITRLLHRRDRSAMKNDSQLRTLSTSVCDSSFDLNEKLDSPLVYVNGDSSARQTKSVVTNSKQTSKIVRRWNDVRRRSRLKALYMKLSNEIATSDHMDDNSGLGPDDISLPYSNDSNSNSGIKDDDIAINRTKLSQIQTLPVGLTEKSATRNLNKKSDANFDRLTQDIQNAVNGAHSTSIGTLPVTSAIPQQQIKRSQKVKFSPYMTKSPSHFPQLPSNVHDIFKSNA